MLSALLLGLAGCQAVKEPEVAYRSNVPYGEVLQQPYRIASAHRSYGKDSLQTLYQWHTQDKPSSILIFIHGGCWLNLFDYTHGRGLFNALAKDGVMTIAVEYRRTGDDGGGWPGTFDDVKAGITESLEWIQQEGLNSLPVYLAGHSAGGHLALLAAQEFEDRFNSVIGLAAITDPVQYAQGSNSCQTATPAFFGGLPAEKSAEYNAATPSAEELPANTILLQGTADNIVPVSQSEMPGVSRQLIEGAGHFDYLHSQSLAYQQFLTILKSGQ